MMIFWRAPPNMIGPRHVVFRRDDDVRQVARHEVAGLVGDKDPAVHDRLRMPMRLG